MTQADVDAIVPTAFAAGTNACTESMVATLAIGCLDLRARITAAFAAGLIAASRVLLTKMDNQQMNAQINESFINALTSHVDTLIGVERLLAEVA
jgi:hypothetical protein